MHLTASMVPTEVENCIKHVTAKLILDKMRSVHEQVSVSNKTGLLQKLKNDSNNSHNNDSFKASKQSIKTLPERLLKEKNAKLSKQGSQALFIKFQ